MKNHGKFFGLFDFESFAYQWLLAKLLNYSPYLRLANYHRRVRMVSTFIVRGKPGVGDLAFINKWNSASLILLIPYCPGIQGVTLIMDKSMRITFVPYGEVTPLGCGHPGKPMTAVEAIHEFRRFITSYLSSGSKIPTHQ